MNKGSVSLGYNVEMQPRFTDTCPSVVCYSLIWGPEKKREKVRKGEREREKTRERGSERGI